MLEKILNEPEGYFTGFSECPFSIGDFVYVNLDNNSQYLTYRNFEYRRIDDTLIGVSLCNVVNLDLTKQTLPNRTVQIGSRFHITNEVILVYNIPYDGIPLGQSMYVSKDGKPTWKRTGPKIGTAYSSQDKDGFIKIKLKIGE